MNILVTGSAGMIGGYVVKGLVAKGHTVTGIDLRENAWKDRSFHQHVVDLADISALSRVFENEHPQKVIHLAALAHTAGEKDTSFERFKRINVDYAKNVFSVAEACHCEVLFISTVDAIGMVKDVVTPQVTLNPISAYGRSKAMAEDVLKGICTKWNIYRFSPVYTKNIKRDIEKRYYLKYPNWAYKIGEGGRFEVLDVELAVETMVAWTDRKADNTISIVKDPELLDINDLIKAEKAEGRAKHVLWLPRWIVVCGYYCLLAVFGECNKTYLVFKALWPFRS